MKHLDVVLDDHRSNYFYLLAKKGLTVSTQHHWPQQDAWTLHAKVLLKESIQELLENKTSRHFPTQDARMHQRIAFVHVERNARL